MQYAQTFALVSAALATLASAQPHAHQHAHHHVAREAEPEAEAQHWTQPVAGTTILQESDFAPVTQTVTATAGQEQQQTPAAQQQTTAAQVVSAAAVQQSSHAKSQTTIATVAKSSAAKSGTPTASSAKSTSTGSSSGSGSGSSNGSPTVKIINSCSKTIWIGEGNNAMQSLAPGGSPFETPLSGSSISWKMGWDSQASWEATNAEIEFTVTGSNAMTYDLSLQKGNPFLQYGQKLELSDSSCKTISCAPNQFPCPNAYNTLADNSKVGQPSLPCSKASITFTACSG